MLWKHNANDCEGKWGVQNVSSIFQQSSEGSRNAKQLKCRFVGLDRHLMCAQELFSPSKAADSRIQNPYTFSPNPPNTHSFARTSHSHFPFYFPPRSLFCSGGTGRRRLGNNYFSSFSFLLTPSLFYTQYSTVRSAKKEPKGEFIQSYLLYLAQQVAYQYWVFGISLNFLLIVCIWWKWFTWNSSPHPEKSLAAARRSGGQKDP